MLTNSDPQDDSFYPILTFMINSYYIITQQASWCQTMILRMIPTIPFSHSWSILIISSLSKPRVNKQWSSGWFYPILTFMINSYYIITQQASWLPNSDPQDDSFYPIHTFTINSYYIITQQASCYQSVISRMNLLSYSHTHDQFLLYHY